MHIERDVTDCEVVVVFSWNRDSFFDNDKECINYEKERFLQFYSVFLSRLTIRKSYLCWFLFYFRKTFPNQIMSENDATIQVSPSLILEPLGYLANHPLTDDPSISLIFWFTEIFFFVFFR